ncbi:MAG TPA: class II aldolase/adducin family protein [Dehalococcoidia bacterium]|jgi:L-fuculose-phosphate aldolase|nr:class II aldolase/adducin family protein [Dehalococcoidia bacterium]
MSAFDAIREAVAQAYRRCGELGLVASASGNVSARVPGRDDLFAITPSRIPFFRVRAGDVLVVDFEIEPVEGEGIPSSESLTHLAVYRARPDVGAVVHTHPVYASAFAVAGRPIPPILDEQVVLIGGTVEVADYAMAGTEDLARQAIAALGERNAVLLRHHGALACGKDLDEALAVAELLERVAQIYVLSLGLGQAPALPADVVATEQQLFRMSRPKGTNA